MRKGSQVGYPARLCCFQLHCWLEKKKDVSESMTTKVQRGQSPKMFILISNWGGIYPVCVLLGGGGAILVLEVELSNFLI